MGKRGGDPTQAGKPKGRPGAFIILGDEIAVFGALLLQGASSQILCCSIAKRAEQLGHKEKDPS